MDELEKIRRKYLMRNDSGWKEKDHPRAKDGKFTSSVSSGVKTAEDPLPPSEKSEKFSLKSLKNKYPGYADEGSEDYKRFQAEFCDEIENGARAYDAVSKAFEEYAGGEPVYDYFDVYDYFVEDGEPFAYIEAAGKYDDGKEYSFDGLINGDFELEESNVKDNGWKREWEYYRSHGDSGWEERKHPRAKDGRFTSGGAAAAVADKPKPPKNSGGAAAQFEERKNEILKRLGREPFKHMTDGLDNGKKYADDLRKELEKGDKADASVIKDKRDAIKGIINDFEDQAEIFDFEYNSKDARAYRDSAKLLKENVKGLMD